MATAPGSAQNGISVRTDVLRTLGETFAAFNGAPRSSELIVGSHDLTGLEKERLLDFSKAMFEDLSVQEVAAQDSYLARNMRTFAESFGIRPALSVDALGAIDAGTRSVESSSLADASGSIQGPSL